LELIAACSGATVLAPFMRVLFASSTYLCLCPFKRNRISAIYACVLCSFIYTCARVAKSVSKWESTSAHQKTMENFCDLHRLLWRHKHWNETSL